MTTAKLKMRDAAKRLNSALNNRYSEKRESVTAGAVGSSFVAIGGQLAPADLPEGTTGTVSVVNVGRMASARYATETGAVIVSSGTTSISSSGGVTVGDVNGLIAVHAAQPDIHHARVTLASPSGLILSGQQLALDDLIAGAGLAISSKVLSVGAGLGILVNANDVQINPTIAGAGIRHTLGVLSIDQGDGILINTDGIQVRKATNSGLAFDGAGALIVGTPQTLTVGSTNSLSGDFHNHAVTASSSPGAATALLKTDVTGTLILTRLNTVTLGSATTTDIIPDGDLSLIPGGTLWISPQNYQATVGTNVNIRLLGYASQTTGWAIDGNGAADFRYLFTDELHAKSFIADLEQALAGGQIICKSVAMLAVDFTAPAASGTATLRVRDLPSAANMACFQSGDIVRVRTFSRSGGGLTIADCWGVVTSYTDQADGTQTWTFTRSAAPNAGAMTAGTVVKTDAIVLDYGVSGNGFHEVNAIDGVYGANSPYSQIVTWTTHPATGQSVRVRTGNLTGVGFSGKYGQVVYGASSAEYIRSDNDGIVLRRVSLTLNGGSSDTVTILPSGDAKFGSDVASVATTSLFLLGVNQTYNAEAFESGDIIFGNHAAAHMMWDKSAGRLNLRSGTFVRCYIDTSGFNAGVVRMDSGGINVAATALPVWGLTAGLENVSVVADHIYSFSEGAAIFGGIAGGKSTTIDRTVMYTQVTNQDREAQTIIDARFVDTGNPNTYDRPAKVTIAASRWFPGMGITHNSYIEVFAGSGNVDKITMSSDSIDLNVSGTVTVNGSFAATNFAASSFSANGANIKLVGTIASAWQEFFPAGTGAGRKAYFGFPGASNLELINEYAGGELRFGTSSATKARIDSSGRLGVGRVPTANLLEIASRIASYGSGGLWMGTSGGTDVGFFGMDVDTTSAIVGIYRGGDFRLYVDSANEVKVNAPWAQSWQSVTFGTNVTNYGATDPQGRALNNIGASKIGSKVVMRGVLKMTGTPSQPVTNEYKLFDLPSGHYNTSVMKIKYCITSKGFQRIDFHTTGEVRASYWTTAPANNDWVSFEEAFVYTN